MKLRSNLTSKALCAAVLAGAAAAQAQVPSGPAPPTASTPAGLATTGPDAPWYLTPNGGAPITTADELFASGGAVYVTFLGPTAASYDETLFVESPTTGYGTFMDNHTTANGTTYFLGDFAAGTEIEFGIDVLSSGSVWYDGPGSRNADGDIHAYMVNNYESLADTTYVGFEDLGANQNSDWNYGDEIYAFTGVAASVNPPTVPDSASTLSLLGLGFGSLAFLGRRFRK